MDQGLDLHVLNAAKTHTSAKGKCTWADIREAEGTVAFNGCVELNVAMMLKVFTYHGPNPRNSEHIAGLALRASFRFNSSRWHGPFARLQIGFGDVHKCWKLERMGQAEGGSFMKLDRRQISLTVSKRFSEPLFQPHTNHQPRHQTSHKPSTAIAERPLNPWISNLRVTHSLPSAGFVSAPLGPGI